MSAPADLLRLIPHRAPHPVLDRVLSVDDERAVVQKRVSTTPLEGLWLLELSAQATAVWSARNAGEPHIGYLVAARGWKFPRSAQPGETLTISVEPSGGLGALASFRARVSVGDEELAAGELTCAIVKAGEAT